MSSTTKHLANQQWHTLQEEEDSNGKVREEEDRGQGVVEEDRGQGVVDVEVHMVDREAHIVEEAKEALVAEEGSKEQLIITSSSQGLAEVEEAEEEDLQPIIRTSLGLRTTRLSKVLQTRLSPLVLTAVLKTVLRATMEVKAEEIGCYLPSHSSPDLQPDQHSTATITTIIMMTTIVAAAVTVAQVMSTKTRIPVKSQTNQASSRMIKFQVLAVELWVKVA